MEALLLVFATRQGQAGAALLSDLLLPFAARACVLHGRSWEVEQGGFPGNPDSSLQLLSSGHVLSALGL